jgi:hypothetical protein
VNPEITPPLYKNSKGLQFTDCWSPQYQAESNENIKSSVKEFNIFQNLKFLPMIFK